MTQPPHVLIFDSGVGGLSVAREVLTAFPHCQLTYASDNAAFPYGSKSPEWLISRVETVIEALLRVNKPDIVVIACNTASTLTLPHLRNRFSTPFVGVVPAIKPAAHISRTKTVGILATPATVSRPYTQQLIADHASDCRVSLHGSTELVYQAERKLFGQMVDKAKIEDELGCLLESPNAAQLDTIVLACTHFPLLKNELQQAALPRNFQWVDSGEAIARRVGYWLAQLPANGNSASPKDSLPIEPAQNSVVFTAPPLDWPALQRSLATYLPTNTASDFTLLELKHNP